MSVRERLPAFDGDRFPLWNRLSYNYRTQISDALFTALTLILLLIILFPLFWIASSAFRPQPALRTVPVSLIPEQLTLDNFVYLFQETDFPLWLRNSLIVTSGVVIITTITATLGGYGLTRFEIPYKNHFARLILFGYMFPPILLAIPMFIFWRQLGWINSYIGLTFAIVAFSLPFSLWLTWKFFQTVPLSLEESARMNGATRFRAFFEIALPRAKPGIVAVAVMSYAIAWNSFTTPTVLMIDSSRYVLVQGLFRFTLKTRVEWGVLMAASLISILPAFFFVSFLQKYLLTGFRT